jgi:hypothetical protein
MQLTRIAEVLGCPVSFFKSPPRSSFARVDELLRLWSMIEDANDQTKVLNFIQQVIESKEAAID